MPANTTIYCLPTTRKEMEYRGWDEVDIVLFSGDAYVDHPQFGAAVLGRLPVTVWLSFLNPTGAVTTATSLRWAVRASSLA